MTPNAVSSARSTGRSRSTAGVVVAVLGAIALTMGVAGSTAAGLENAPSDRHVAQAGADCSDGVLVGMNFAVDPIDDDYFFDSITMNVGGDVYTFSGDDLVPNGGSADNVFVAAPAGLGYDDVASATFSAEIGPFGYGYPKFVWSFVCRPAPTTTTVEETTTTVEETTTTVEETTTTVEETTTTTEGEASRPPTVDTTPTTVANVAPTTVATGNNSPTTVATQLPQTGSTNTMLALGALLLLVGGVMVLSTRREHDLA